MCIFVRSELYTSYSSMSFKFMAVMSIDLEKIVRIQITDSEQTSGMCTVVVPLRLGSVM